MSKLLLRVALVTCTLAAPASLACSSFAPTDETPEAGADAAPADASTDAALTDASDASVACDAGEGRGCGERFVFLTSGMLPGSFAAGAMSSLPRADAFCAEQALLAGKAVLRKRKWKAFLCTSTVSAIDRVATVEARWVGPDRDVHWPTTTSLRYDGPTVALGPTSPVWTGCDNKGRPSAEQTCRDWTSMTGDGAYGQAAQTTQRWASAGVEVCADSFPIYCFEAGE